MGKLVWKMLVNIVVFMCLGSFVDSFAGTGYVCAIIGVVVGIVVTILANKIGK